MDIITSTEGLVPGDVLYVSKLVQPRGGEEYWWRAYWIVKSCPTRHFIDLMLLKMHPDPEKDHRMFDFDACGDKQVIQYLHPDKYPQGVSAMKMKHVTLGTIRLGGE